jgi:hypothetical protein
VSITIPADDFLISLTEEMLGSSTAYSYCIAANRRYSVVENQDSDLFQFVITG